MRSGRKLSEANIYHVIVRGAGRQIIFEDDQDRRRYLDDLKRFTGEHEVSILAWCLMSNHVHLLLEGKMPDISALMQTFNSEYAQYFNLRHDHVGPLFQGRFKSEPINDDAQLLTTLRYIHKNPEKAGMGPAKSYTWCSYREYADAPEVCDTARILDALGSKNGFARFHDGEHCFGGVRIMHHVPYSRMSEAELLDVAQDATGVKDVSALKGYPKEERNEAILQMRAIGLSIRQIERITGIGRGIISRVRPPT